MECKFCSGTHNPTAEIEYVDPRKKEGYCGPHSQLLFATGTALDRINRNHVGTYRSMESHLAKLRTDDPTLWTRDRNYAKRISRGNRSL